MGDNAPYPSKIFNAEFCSTAEWMDCVDWQLLKKEMDVPLGINALSLAFRQAREPTKTEYSGDLFQ
jgi:hypothetical protein